MQTLRGSGKGDGMVKGIADGNGGGEQEGAPENSEWSQDFAIQTLQYWLFLDYSEAVKTGRNQSKSSYILTIGKDIESFKKENNKFDSELSVIIKRDLSGSSFDAVDDFFSRKTSKPADKLLNSIALFLTLRRLKNPQNGIREVEDKILSLCPLDARMIRKFSLAVPPKPSVPPGICLTKGECADSAKALTAVAKYFFNVDRQDYEAIAKKLIGRFDPALWGRKAIDLDKGYFEAYRYTGTPGKILKSVIVVVPPCKSWPYARFVNYVWGRGLASRYGDGIILDLETNYYFVGRMLTDYPENEFGENPHSEGHSLKVLVVEKEPLAGGFRPGLVLTQHVEDRRTPLVARIALRPCAQALTVQKALRESTADNAEITKDRVLPAIRNIFGVILDRNLKDELGDEELVKLLRRYIRNETHFSLQHDIDLFEPGKDIPVQYNAGQGDMKRHLMHYMKDQKLVRFAKDHTKVFDYLTNDYYPFNQALMMWGIK